MSIDIKGIKVPADGVCSPNFSEGFDETHISMPLQSALTFFQNISMITRKFKEAMSFEIKTIKNSIN